MIKDMKTGQYEAENIDYLYIEGIFTESLEYARQFKDGPYGRYYHLLVNNCKHFSQDVLLHGDFLYDTMELAAKSDTSPVPRDFYYRLALADASIKKLEETIKKRSNAKK